MSACEPSTNNPAEQAIEQLLQRLVPVSVEAVDWSSCAGRVLAEPLRADRDSPPLTVSAMDGYACRWSDIAHQHIDVAGEVRIGQAPIELPLGNALRIFTGGCVPVGADLVIRREDVEEAADHIVIRDPAAHSLGASLRRQGENLKSGEEVLPAGSMIHAPAAAALTTFGLCRPRVYRRVKLGVLVTGDELLPPEATPQPWQIRDSNGPALQSMFKLLPWMEVAGQRRAADDLQAISRALAELLEESDAVFLTGGVSMGDHDYVPAAIKAVGAEIVFHRLSIRPGKPILGAVGPGGQVILGLPGNPVSVMVTARRFGSAALRSRAGFSQPQPSPPVISAEGSVKRATDLWWYQPVRLSATGTGKVAANRGSGDVAGAACSDGFVEVPPVGAAMDQGRLPFWDWQI